MLKLKIVPSQDLKNNQIEVPEIYIHETPVTNSWSLIPLYKMTFQHGLISWQITYNEDLSSTFTVRTDDENNNIATSILNYDTLVPSIIAARCYYRDKYREGFRPAGESTAIMDVGMKGYSYKSTSAINWPAYVQPKLHGIRMLCQDNGQTINMSSYENNAYTHLTHITKEIVDFFAYLPRFAILDGEFYNHTMSFSKLISIVKTRKYVHPQLTTITFHIFDINYQPKVPFEKRYELLVNAFRKYVQDHSSIHSDDDITALPLSFTVVGCQYISSREQLVRVHNSNVQQGYEGSMIKKLSNGASVGSTIYNDSLYQSHKCNHILKYKDFQDEEAVIISIIDSNSLMARDIRNNMLLLTSRIPLTLDAIGKNITYRYSHLNQGVPESPTVVAIRDYE